MSDLKIFLSSSWPTTSPAHETSSFTNFIKKVGIACLQIIKSRQGAKFPIIYLAEQSHTYLACTRGVGLESNHSNRQTGDGAWCDVSWKFPCSLMKGIPLRDFAVFDLINFHAYDLG